MEDKKMTEQLSFEEAMARLEEIVSALEKGEATLDEMLSLYEGGSALMRRAGGLLEQAKRKVEMVKGNETVPFDGGAQD